MFFNNTHIASLNSSLKSSLHILKRLAFVLAVIAVIIVIDQYTKYQAIMNLKFAPTQSYFFGTFLLLYAENIGAWGSIGSTLSPDLRFWLLTVLPIGFLIGLLFYTLLKKDLKRYEIVCYALIVGGGAGNLIDRAVYGYVVDFMYFGYGGIGTNIFNVADVVIMTGVICLIVLQMILRSPEAAPLKQQQQAP